MSPDNTNHVWLRDLVINAFERGKRSDNVDNPSDSWMKPGLEAIEKGKTLTVDMIKQFTS